MEVEFSSKDVSGRRPGMDTGALVASGCENESAGFKSPPRILVRFFKKSRDRWKAKYQTLQTKMKRFRNRVADATRARDRWRERAETAEAEAKRLRVELAAGAESVPQGAQKKG